MSDEHVYYANPFNLLTVTQCHTQGKTIWQVEGEEGSATIHPMHETTPNAWNEPVPATTVMLKDGQATASTYPTIRDAVGSAMQTLGPLELAKINAALDSIHRDMLIANNTILNEAAK